MRTIADVVANGQDAATAIAAIEGPPLTYRALRQQMARTVEQLNRLGIGRGDPVGIVLPNGPAMATAFVSIAAGAVAAPLNPAVSA